MCELATSDRCGVAIVTTLHELRDCSKATTVWNLFISNVEKFQFFSIPIVEWVSSNLKKKLKTFVCVSTYNL